jgi:hypothetical protein
MVELLHARLLQPHLTPNGTGIRRDPNTARFARSIAAA